MSDQRTSSGTGGITPAGGRSSTDVVRLDEGHHVGGGGGLPARFEDPGLPPHVERLADRDPEAGRRAERQVATLFGLSMLATLVFLVGYFAIDYTQGVYLPGIGRTNLLNVVLGISMGLSLFLIGAGAVHWAKTLMPDEEVVEERHPQRSDDATRAKAVDVIVGGGEAAQLGRRPILRYSLGGALGLFALPFAVQVAGSLGNPTVATEELAHTIWDVKPGPDSQPIRLFQDPQMTPIKASDVTIGSVFHIMPESLQRSTHVLENKAKAAVIMMRLDPSEFDAGAQGQKALSGATRASSPTPRSAPTWAARSVSTSSRPTTCCARVTSRPST